MDRTDHGTDGSRQADPVVTSMSPFDASLLEYLLDASESGVYVKDQDLRFIRMNRAYARLLGVHEPAHAEGLTDASFLIGAHVARIGAEEERIVRTGQAHAERAETIETLDGRTSNLRVRRVPVRDGVGVIVGLLGICTTEGTRRVGDDALAARLDALTRPEADLEDLRFSDMFDLDELQRLQDAFAAATGVAALITEPDGTPITRPSNFTRLCGHLVRQTELGAARCAESDSQIGKVHAGGPIVQHCLSAGLCNAGTSIRVGGRHVANWLIGQVLDETHDESMIAGYARAIGVDAEEFRRALSEVPRMRSERFRRVADALYLTAQHLSLLAYRNLQQARHIEERHRAEEERRQLEAQVQHAQKLESLGILAGGIAHDFNNLLVGVLGNAAAAADLLDPASPALECVRRIELAATRAADLAKQMLAYSGKGRFVTEVLDLAGLVGDMAHLLESSVSKGADLRYEIDRGTAVVEADPTQLRQVVMNLITNASEALPDGRGTITVRVGTTEADAECLSQTYIQGDLVPGVYALLEVSDSGVGMDAHTLSRVFEPFFSTKSQGRGLGMAAIVGIVRGHGGALSISSTPGAGTTIRILLPVTDQPVTAREAAPTGAPPMEPTSAGLILVADDEEAVRQVASLSLEMAGFEVVTADDGLEAVRVFTRRQDEIRALVLDVTMPGLSGTEVFDRVRDLRPDVPVVLSSGYDEGDSTGQLAGRGLAGFIQKPYRPVELVEAIRRALTGG